MKAGATQGLGKQFLTYAYDRANRLGLNGLSLIDYAANTGARRVSTSATASVLSIPARSRRIR